MFVRRFLPAMMFALCLATGCTDEGEGGGASSPPAPLEVATTSLPGADQGWSYNTSLAAQGGTAPYIWSVGGTSPLPGGVMLSTDGILSGVPTVAGTFDLTFEVEDSIGMTASAMLQLDVASAPALVITTTSLPNAVQAQAYSTTISASGGSGAGYTWVVNAATPLPQGLALAGAGTPDTTLSGTTNADGTFSIDIELQDSIGLSASATLVLTVDMAPPPVFVTGASLPSGQETVAYTETLSVSGGVGPYQWSVAAGSSLPPGLTLGGSSGVDEVLSGTPSAEGTYSFELEVEDALQHSASQTFHVDVAPAPDSWRMSATSAEVDRQDGSVVWTGTHLIQWGGAAGKNPTNMGVVLDPRTGNSTPMSTTNAPSARLSHSAVWTGSVMIVWGGYEVVANIATPVEDGGIYDPANDTWTAIPPGWNIGVGVNRYGHVAVWTGSEMIVWGGRNAVQSLSDGAAYNPATGQWRVLTSAPIGHRWLHRAVWTGTEMVIWGGVEKPATGPDTPLFDGAMYDPASDVWTTTIIPFSGSPNVAAREGAVVWANGKLVVWGADNNSTTPAGGIWDPTTGSWTVMSTTNQPSSRRFFAHVWTGTELIVWSGLVGSTQDTLGGVWNMTSDTWRPISQTNVPAGRTFARAWWTDGRMLVWGGRVSATAMGAAGEYWP